MPAKLLLALAASLALVALSAPSSADPQADAEAQALFEQGRALMKEGHFAEACPRLERSQRLSPSGGTMLNLAACHERLGRVATAWVEYQQALTAAKVDGKDDRARLAAERIAALEGRVPWLTIELDAGGEQPTDAVVELDDARLDEAALGRPMPVDPGEHRIRIAAGGATHDERVELAEGDKKTISLATPRRVPPPPPAVVERREEAPARKPAAAPASADASPPHRRNRAVGELGFFVGPLHGGVSQPELAAGADSVSFTTLQGSSSCAQSSCSLDFADSDTAIVGLTGFVGWAVTDRFHLGLRGLGAYRFGGGSLLAVGPLASVRAFGPFWLGAGFVVGMLQERGTGTVQAQGSTMALGSYAMTESTGLTVGNTIELGLAIVETDAGSLMVQATPTILIGSRELAVAVPVGVAFRFH